MANLNQFFKGEVIQITVTNDSGTAITGATILAYLDSLDLTDDTNKPEPKKFTEGSNGVYTIAGDDTIEMTAGSYTIEVIQNIDTSGSRTIVKTNNAFTLVDSGYSLDPDALD